MVARCGLLEEVGSLMHGTLPPPTGDHQGTQPIHPTALAPTESWIEAEPIGRPQGSPLHLSYENQSDSTLIFLNWSRKRFLCPIFQFPFIAPYKDRKCYEEKYCKHNRNSSYSPGQAMNLLSQEVATQSIERGPDKSS